MAGIVASGCGSGFVIIGVAGALFDDVFIPTNEISGLLWRLAQEEMKYLDK